MKKAPKTQKPIPAYSINRLSEILGADRRTLKKALCGPDGSFPDGNGPSGPTFTKRHAVSQLLYLKRGCQEVSAFDEMRRGNYAMMAGMIGCGVPFGRLIECQEYKDGLVTWELAEYLGVRPEEIDEKDIY
jgi:hypothetical protein